MPMSAIVFGSPRAVAIGQRIAAAEREARLPLRRYEVRGFVTIRFEVEVEARTQDGARDEVWELSLSQLCGMDDGDRDIETVEVLGLAHPEDPTEVEKARLLLECENEALPAERLL